MYNYKDVVYSPLVLVCFNNKANKIQPLAFGGICAGGQITQENTLIDSVLFCFFTFLCKT